MADPVNEFDGFFTSDELDRQKNEGQYKRTPGYYARANAREVMNSLTGDPRRLHNINSVSDVVEGIMPGGLSGLYSVIDMGQMALQDLVPTPEFFLDGKQKEPVHLPGGEAATRMYEKSREAANDFFGVEEIEGTGDFVAGVLPTLLAPGPKLDKAKTLLGKTAQTGAALTLPFAQSKIGSFGHAMEGALPLAVSEGAAAVGDLPKNVFDSALRTNEAVTGELDMSGFNDEELDMSGFVNDDSLEGLPGDDSADAWYATREAQFGAGTALALVAARIATHGARLNLFRRRPAPHPDQISGELEFTEPLDARTHAAKGFLDKSVPLPDTIKKLGGTDEEIKDMEANVSAMMNPVSQSNIGTTALQFGLFPGMTRRVESLGRIMRSVARLGDDNADLYNRAMSALDMVSRLKPGQVIDDGKGGMWDAARLNAIIHQARQVPGVARAMARTRQWYDDMREVLTRNGVISQAEAARWAQDHPEFVHTQIDFKNTDSLLKQFLTAIGTDNQGPIPDSAAIRALTQRSLDPQYGVLPGQGMNLLETMEKYGQSVIRAVLENNNKRYFFHQVDRLSNNTGGGIVKRVDGPGKNTVSFFENGEQRHYRIYDSALYDSLLNQPVLVVPVLNDARAMMHFFATGAGNPFFVWNAAMYDTLLSPFTRMNGNSLGPLDELIRRATKGKWDVSNTIGIDPSAILNWPVGSTRFLYGAFMKEMGERLDASIAANTAFARSLNAIGLPAQHVLQIIDDAYSRSMHYMWNSLGGGANASTLATPEALRSSIAQTAPEVVGYLNRRDSLPSNPIEATRRIRAGISANTTWRAYSALMNALHSGVKFQHFAANTVPTAGLTRNQMRRKQIRAAHSSRELTVNAARTGDNVGYRIYASSALWGNVGVQSLYQLSRAMKDHPWRLATMTAATGYATFGWLSQFFGGDQEMADYYYKTLTPTQRVQMGIPLYVDERGDMQFMPIDPSMRPVIAVMTELYGAMAGHTAELPRSDEERNAFTRAVNTVFGTDITEAQQDNIMAGAATGLVNALPGADFPVANLAFKEAGMNPQNSLVPWLMQRGEMFTPEKDSMLSPEDERSVHSTLPRFVENILSETLGTVGRRMVDAVNTFGRVIKSDATPLTAADAAYTQWQQSWKDADRGKPLQSLWTKQTNDKKVDIFNEISRRNRLSLDGIDSILEWGKKGVKGAGNTGGTIAFDVPGTSVSLAGQKLISLYAAVQPFRRIVDRPLQVTRDLQAQIEDVERSPLLALRPDEQRQKVNELKLRLLEQQHFIYALVQQFEDNMTKTLGKRIRLHDFDPDDWADTDAIQQPAPLPRQQ